MRRVPTARCPASPRPRQHRGRKHPPGNDPIQRQAARQALAPCALACCNPTPALQHPVPDCNAPATGRPLPAWGGVVARLDRDGGQQQPRAGRDVRWRLACLAWYGPPRDHRQACARARAGRTPRQGTKPPRPRRVPSPLWPPTWPWQQEVGAHRLCGYRSPDIALGPRDPPGPRGPHQQIAPRRARSGPHVIDIGCAVPDAHQPGRGTAGRGSGHGVETGEPFLPFFLAAGQVRAPRPCPPVGRGPGPNLVRQEPQRPVRGRDRSRHMDQQPVAGCLAQRAQPLGSRVPRPVACGGSLHGQDHRDSAHAGVRRFAMTVQEVLGGDAVMIKETRGSFQQAAIATRVRQSSGRMLS